MEGMHELKKKLCEELEGYGRRGELPPSALDRVHKLTDTVKNIDKILMLEELNENDDSYEAGGGSYRGGRGGGRKSYASDGGNTSYNNYGGGNSGRRDRYDRYSRSGGEEDGKEKMRREIEKKMEHSETDREREMYSRWLEELEKD